MSYLIEFVKESILSKIFGWLKDPPSIGIIILFLVILCRLLNQVRGHFCLVSSSDYSWIIVTERLQVRESDWPVNHGRDLRIRLRVVSIVPRVKSGAINAIRILKALEVYLDVSFKCATIPEGCLIKACIFDYQRGSFKTRCFQTSSCRTNWSCSD